MALAVSDLRLHVQVFKYKSTADAWSRHEDQRKGNRPSREGLIEY